MREVSKEKLRSLLLKGMQPAYQLLEKNKALETDMFERQDPFRKLEDGIRPQVIYMCIY